MSRHTLGICSAWYTSATPQALRALSVQILIWHLSTYIYGEGILCHFLERYKKRLAAESDVYRYISQEQKEEYEHQKMFEQLILSLWYRPIRPKYFKRVIAHASIYLGVRYFLLIQMQFELMSQEISIELIKDPTVHPILRSICIYHEREETGHIQLNQALLDKYCIDRSWLSRTIWWWCIVANTLFLRWEYARVVYTDIYGSNQLERTHQSMVWDLKKCDIFNFRSQKALNFIHRYRLITSGNRWAFRFFLRYTHDLYNSQSMSTSSIHHSNR